uniref:Uncharacterized protein n=1 Tax=Octopus bimaculoides TaxID=37653 RepID=A0A0L8GH07_OCTBM
MRHCKTAHFCTIIYFYFLRNSSRSLTKDRSIRIVSWLDHLAWWFCVIYQLPFSVQNL